MPNLGVIYLDYNASSPLPLEVAGEVPGLLDLYGNPSSLHLAGRRARRLINDATEEVATYLGCHHHQVFWTSGGSESNSWVIHSAIERARLLTPLRAPRLIISAIEHDSVELAAEHHAAQGVVVEICRVNAHGIIDLAHLKELLDAAPADLVCVMHSNNETGVIQPIEAVAALCQVKGVSYHCDAVQALGKTTLKLEGSGISYATFSSHKIGAIKGVGFVIVTAKGRLLHPLIHGKQQKELRGGTENTFGVALTGRILRALRKGIVATRSLELAALRDRFEAELMALVPGTVIHGAASARLASTSYIGFEQIDGDSVLMNLDLEGVCASSGAACSSGSTEPSSVLLAMGLDAKIARSSVRFSGGYATRWDDYQRVLEVLPGIVERTRKSAALRQQRVDQASSIEVQL